MASKQQHFGRARGLQNEDIPKPPSADRTNVAEAYQRRASASTAAHLKNLLWYLPEIYYGIAVQKIDKCLSSLRNFASELAYTHATHARTKMTTLNLERQKNDCDRLWALGTLWQRHPIRCLVRLAQRQEDPFPHRLMKLAIFTILGVLAGSILAWGSLMGWASLKLHQQDSLFDRDPHALNLFLGTWLALVLLGVAIGLRASKKAPRRLPSANGCTAA